MRGFDSFNRFADLQLSLDHAAGWFFCLCAYIVMKLINQRKLSKMLREE